jgi:two-component system NtrC family sensor kinase
VPEVSVTDEPGGQASRAQTGSALPPEFGAEKRKRLRHHFGRLGLGLKVGLIFAFVTPLAALSFYFHFQFDRALKGSGKLHLAALAESQKNTVDLFLQERVVNLFAVFQSSAFSLDPSAADMAHYLDNLRRASDAFIDVGFFGPDGVQKAYAGPFPLLKGKDYSGEKWLKTLMKQERLYYISDIYLGFRNNAHFTIAVKQRVDETPYVVRVTLDPGKFYEFLRTISRGEGVESFLLNQEGRYQVVAPGRGQVLGLSSYVPRAGRDAGVEEVTSDGQLVLAAYAALKETPWTLVVRQPLSVAYAQMYRVRRIMIAATAVLVVIIVSAIWLGTDRLIKRAEKVAEAREELRYQLIHASKLASVGELAAGVAHEINNPLAIILAVSGVIRDMLDPRFGLDGSPARILGELDNLDAAVFRARGITRKLLTYARKNEPRLTSCDVNRLLDGVVGGFLEKEFEVSNIRLVRDYAPDLPLIPLDVDEMSQVFLNLINNAGDAIDGAGTITLSTRRMDGSVRVAVTDTGRGMLPEQMKKIFLPFFTTKSPGKGTGLGLSISLNIVEAMGGTIEVQSLPGAGSSFIVYLPIAGAGDAEAGAAPGRSGDAEGGKGVA